MFHISRTQHKSPSFAKFTLDYHSSSITQSQPYPKKREEYHMDKPLSHTMIINNPRNPTPHTTRTTQDHEDDGIMETI